ncbi:MAG: AlpA family phage regulatory protein [Thiofilum sp.]|uniref:helix-turn-helix transcriptional regulator n=1 Tax=Thiofilum sp. TaxID=2212733 RepID=UPI0025D0934B|nr:AlpA family phage regulatory protein [Thiofilum sp.]MBK8454113.1 AlpA family phage regulatory protein [Thiofilum sp.]
MSLLPPRKKPAVPETLAPESTAPAPLFEDRLLRLAEVCHKVGLGKSTIYTMIREGRFPKPVKYSAKINTWRLSEINAYINGEFVPTPIAPVIQLVQSNKRGRV